MEVGFVVNLGWRLQEEGASQSDGGGMLRLGGSLS